MILHRLLRSRVWTPLTRKTTIGQDSIIKVSTRLTGYNIPEGEFDFGLISMIQPQIILMLLQHSLIPKYTGNPDPISSTISSLSDDLDLLDAQDGAVQVSGFTT